MKSSFPDTLWTRLIEVIQREPVGSMERNAALGDFYVLYRPPVLNHIRRTFYVDRFRHASADDLANAFFERLIEKNSLAGVCREKGHFRAWLKTSVENFCRNYGIMEAAGKRGKNITVPLDSAHEIATEDMVLREAGMIFDRGYTSQLYRAVLDELLAEYCARGQGSLFNDLRPFILTDSDNDYRLLAHEHGMRYEAIATAVNRLRKRFGMKLKHKIAEAMINPTPQDIEDEVRYLIRLLSSGPDSEPA